MRLFGERSPSVHGLRRRVAIAAVVAAALLATTVASFADASAAGGSRNARVITEWNAIGVSTAIGTATVGGTARAFNYFAYEQAAVYNAVVGITRKYQLYQWSRLGPRNASPAAAAVAAAHRILVHYFPGSETALNNAYNASIARLPGGTVRAQGITYGRLAADNIIALRTGDGLNDASVTFTVGSGPGAWQPQSGQTFLAPWLSEVHPFTLTSTSQFDPGPPLALTSTQYATELNEVKAKGGMAAGSRTAAETETARFFFDTAVGQLQGGLRDLATRHALDISDSARMFAAVELSIADAVGTAWKSKVLYGFWRPITAIRNADTDGNAATEADTTWAPAADAWVPSGIGTPPYPDWVSGLCSVFGATGRALARVIGSDIDLRITSPGINVTRTYHSAAAMNADAINARVWTGIHFRSADSLAAQLGTNVANWALDHNFGRSR
jgi:hypothetical protein